MSSSTPVTDTADDTWWISPIGVVSGIVFSLMMIAVPLVLTYCLKYIRNKKKYSPNQEDNESTGVRDTSPHETENSITTRSFRVTDVCVESEQSSDCTASNYTHTSKHGKHRQAKKTRRLKFNFKRKRKSFKMETVPPFVVSRQISTATVGSLDLGIPEDIYQILDPESGVYQNNTSGTT